MFDYNDQHNDHHDSLTAVITASNLDFDTDIRFDNDTFSIDNGNLLAQFSTMHQDEDLRNVSFIKYDESFYANFPQSYVNKIHVDFLENFMKASVVIKAPSAEEETRLMDEITKIFDTKVVSTDSQVSEPQDEPQEVDNEPTPVTNKFVDPEAPNPTTADDIADDVADVAFRGLMTLTDAALGIFDEPKEVDGEPTSVANSFVDPEAFKPTAAVDIADDVADVAFRGLMTLADAALGIFDEPQEVDGESAPVANSFVDPEAPSITIADSSAADAAFHDLITLSDFNPSASDETADKAAQYDLPAPDITDKPANADAHTDNVSAQYDLPAPDITDKPANADEYTDNVSAQYDLPAPDISASDEVKKGEDAKTEDNKDETEALDDDIHLDALYDSLFLW
ncbi:hypothetical protein [Anaplasma bovis]|uniref:hypothetical protein n=1 Tax=Anaplasma bovis TaxID=186733 RepID=UPI002FEF94F9